VQGLLAASSYRAVMGKYCDLHTMCLFVLSKINYALQTVTKSFVTGLQENRVSPTDLAEALVLAGLGPAETARQPSARSSSSTHMGSLESPRCGQGRAYLGETSA